MSRIYEPSGRALEYSLLALNHYAGCSHGCKYCYAGKMAIRYGKPFDTGQHLITGVIDQIAKEALKLAGTDKRVLLCFMTDPYQPLDQFEQATRKVITILRKNDIPFQVLTKGGMRASVDFTLYGKHDAFATTMTFLDHVKSKEYEPGAALPSDRIRAIELAHNSGIETWVSLEPVIDPSESLQIIEQTHSIVDLYKIGTLNHVANTTDWRTFGIKAIALCEKHGKKYYIKRDLAKHLIGNVQFTNTDTRLIQRQE